MRIVFINLHANEMLLKTMPKYVFKQSVAIKHGYFLQYLLNREDIEVCSYINKRGFSLMHNGSSWALNTLNLFRFQEHRIVLRKNGISRKNVKIIKRISDIRQDDIVIIYRLYPEQFLGIESITSFKALSMIHFSGEKDEAARIEKSAFSCLFGESNLQKNSEVYRRFYHYDRTWLVHPFVFAERFVNKKPFSARKNKAFATGTITYKTNAEFLETYGNGCDQPSRKQIKDNPEFFKDTIYCTSSDYLEDQKTIEVKASGNRIINFAKSVYNRFHTGQQKKYYSFDMVESFNDYKMCIVGEEILGVPGIGFVEGMACGCAYIGLDSPMYTDVGLIPGVHYITYDGTKEDLKRVIEYYQMDEHQAELEQIAKTGCEYVRTHFNGDAVAKNLLEQLEAEQKKWLAEKGKQNG